MNRKAILSIVIVTFSLLFACAQRGSDPQPEKTSSRPNERPIYSFVEGEDKIQVNKEFQASNHIEPYSTPYTKEVKTFSFSANSTYYDMKLLNCVDCENEGGDFRAIRLYHEGKQILEFIDDEAWIMWTKGEEDWKHPFHEFKETDAHKFGTFTNYCLIYPLKNQATAVLFEGYIWASQVPLLTIIVIKDNQAKVVFNQSWYANKINAFKGGFELDLINDFDEEYQNPHRLSTRSDGTMSLKRISKSVPANP